tara:strand:- start:353 stop:676 length:324 start_codon:yes stop_codon:yes gene_type:complete
MKATRKWILQRLSSLIIAPLIVWFYVSLISLSTKNYSDAVVFFKNPLFAILTVILIFISFFHARIGLSEIFEDYIHNKKTKDVANILTLVSSIIIPIITLFLIIYKI